MFLYFGIFFLQIFTITQLRREYSQHADRCKLANTYDIFMVDKKLMKMAFYHLGSNFRKPEKLECFSLYFTHFSIRMPLPIDASKDITKSLQQAYSLVQLDLAPLKEGIRVRSILGPNSSQINLIPSGLEIWASQSQIWNPT